MGHGISKPKFTGTHALDQEITYFEHHKEKLLRQHKGKVILIKGSSQIGIYNSIEEALAAGAALFGLDSFLAREIRTEPQQEHIPALNLGIIYAPKPSHSI